MEGLALVIHATSLGQHMSLVHELISFVAFKLGRIERQTPIQACRCPFPYWHKYLNMADELIPYFPGRKTMAGDAIHNHSRSCLLRWCFGYLIRESTSEAGAAELQRVELEIQDEEGDCDLEDYVEDYGSNLFHFL